MCNGENLKTARFFAVYDEQWKPVKGRPANIGPKLYWPSLWGLTNQPGQGPKFLKESTTQSCNLGFVVAN